MSFITYRTSPTPCLHKTYCGNNLQDDGQEYRMKVDLNTTLSSYQSGLCLSGGGLSLAVRWWRCSLTGPTPSTSPTLSHLPPPSSCPTRRPTAHRQTSGAAYEPHCSLDAPDALD
ncbi:hypothetical protein E2C01_032170 [Portunus trituberculatus]|uniref:Uncharacterized protein n=1 Tax=Portunus trituberculatus TaxID=210409 RepID=A0A5B7EUP3_PORTR|nr:hypothetical protein [Portunus trituberculatus]